jgi:TolB-like protein
VFTGHPPFHDCSIFEMIAGHMTTVPETVTAKRADVPPAIASLVARCLEKRPADRPAGARELVAVLDGAAVASPSSVAPAAKAVPRASRMLIAGALILVATIAGASGYIAMTSGRNPSSITVAVLPFGNISGDSTLGFLTEGLADEVAGELARVPGIQIKSRSGARAYRGQLGPDVTEAGTKLKAAYIMTGVVRQDGGGWVLSVDVARASDATSIWGESFLVGRDKQAAAARDIAIKLTAALRGIFPRAIGAARALAPSQRTSNSEAYRLYLRGQDKLSRRALSVKESAELFRAATVQDPQYALAHSGLSLALALFPFFQNVTVADIDGELRKAAHRALEIDPTLSQPHVALAIAHRLNWQHDSATIEFLNAFRLDPRDVEARVQYTRHLLFLGRHVEALREMQVARAEDPASALVLSWMSYAYFLNGQMDSAMVESRRALETDPSNLTTLMLGALIRVANNMPAEALALNKASASVSSSYIYVSAKAGDTALALRQIHELDTATVRSTMFDTKRASGFLGLGDTTRALEALERATDRKEIWATLFGPSDPMFDGIRHSSRFHALLRRVGVRLPQPAFSR